jgi:hypothetical protein
MKLKIEVLNHAKSGQLSALSDQQNRVILKAI